MENNKELRLREKIDFYYREKLKCHITKEPRGSINGWIRSELQDGDFYWFEDEHYPIEKVRIFLSDVFDIGDWRPKKEW